MRWCLIDVCPFPRDRCFQIKTEPRTSSSPHPLSSTSCIMGRVLLQYKYNYLLCFIWLLNVKLFMISSQDLFATRVFLNFTSFNSLALKYSVIWRKWGDLVYKRACTVDLVNMEIFFSRKDNYFDFPVGCFSGCLEKGKMLVHLKIPRILLCSPQGTTFRRALIAAKIPQMWGPIWRVLACLLCKV